MYLVVRPLHSAPLWSVSGLVWRTLQEGEQHFRPVAGIFKKELLWTVAAFPDCSSLGLGFWAMSSRLDPLEPKKKIQPTLPAVNPCEHPGREPQHHLPNWSSAGSLGAKMTFPCQSTARSTQVGVFGRREGQSWLPNAAPQAPHRHLAKFANSQLLVHCSKECSS